jgi:hypothetical protein
MNITLKSIPLPDLPTPSAPPSVPADEYESRLNTLYDNAGCDWVLVYADREHTANLTFLTNFDPRFEEALLVLGRDTRALILGNEGMGYTAQAQPILSFVLCQSLSLMGQPRGDAPRLDAVLRKLGLCAGQRVGVVGWKYLEPNEDDESTAPAFVPAYVLRHVQQCVGDGALIDVTHLLMHPTRGLKSHNSAAQLVAFEWAAMHASNAVQRVVRGAHPGQTEREAAAALFQHPGHLISIDEWSHSPIRPGSDEKLGSGMALQCDIIPAPMPNGWSLNCEDTVALGDANLRADLAANFPDVWARIQARRAWMRDTLGLQLAEEVLPLANAPACLTPFWLAADWVCAVQG